MWNTETLGAIAIVVLLVVAALIRATALANVMQRRNLGTSIWFGLISAPLYAFAVIRILS